MTYRSNSDDCERDSWIFLENFSTSFWWNSVMKIVKRFKLINSSNHLTIFLVKFCRKLGENCPRKVWGYFDLSNYLKAMWNTFSMSHSLRQERHGSYLSCTKRVFHILLRIWLVDLKLRQRRLSHLNNAKIPIFRVDLCFQLSDNVTWNFRYIKASMLKKDIQKMVALSNTCYNRVTSLIVTIFMQIDA